MTKEKIIRKLPSLHKKNHLLRNDNFNILNTRVYTKILKLSVQKLFQHAFLLHMATVVFLAHNF